MDNYKTSWSAGKQQSLDDGSTCSSCKCSACHSTMFLRIIPEAHLQWYACGSRQQQACRDCHMELRADDDCQECGAGMCCNSAVSCCGMRTQTMTTKGPSASGSVATYDPASTKAMAITRRSRRRSNEGERIRTYAVQMALTIYTTQPPWVSRKRQEVVYTLMNTRSILKRKSKPNAAS